MAPLVDSASRGMIPPLSGFLERSRVPAVAAILASGGIAVLPTDTLYGFHCASSRLDALETIRGLKGRGGSAGFILLAADLDMVDAIVSRWPGESRALLRGIWPAALTAILPSSRRLPRMLVPRGTVAVRIPAREELRLLARRLGEPIVSTSVNVTGRRPMRSIAGIRASFPGLDAYFSQRGRAGRLPSTVVDFTARPPRLIRPGRYPWPGGV